MCSPTRSSGVLVGHDAAGKPVDVGDNSQKIRFRRPLPAPHTGADRLRATHLVSKSTGFGAALSPTGIRRRRETGQSAAEMTAIDGSGASSDRMSMRHPVILAASRAFWPSLPIASDSW